jgi:hypothetical protein
MSIPAPKVRAPQGKSASAPAVSAAAVLAGATKKGKTTSHLVYTGEAGQEAAGRWLELNAQFAETERELFRATPFTLIAGKSSTPNHCRILIKGSGSSPWTHSGPAPLSPCEPESKA